MDFAKRAEASNPEELVNLCVQQGFAVIRDEGYDPFAGRSEVEQRDWILFGFFIGGGSESAFDQIEWLLQRPFQSVDEWLGPEGDKCRTNWRMPRPDKCRKAWAQFQIEYAGKTTDEIWAEIKSIRARHAEGGWS